MCEFRCNLCGSCQSRVHHTTGGLAMASHSELMGHDNHEDSYGGHMQQLDAYTQAILQVYLVE